jgi:hypothetical protein
MGDRFRTTTLGLVLIATFGSVGLVHGWMTDRWAAHDRSELTKDMSVIPLAVGDGKYIGSDVSDAADDESQGGMARRYLNAEDGDSLTVMLFRGRQGPMVIQHLPTECFICNGYELESPPQRILVDRQDSSGSDEFYMATFRKSREISPLRVRLYWSWTSTGEWQTPEKPRVTFAGTRVLYKLYVSRNLAGDEESVQNARSREFLKHFSQAVRRTLFAKKEN